MNEREETKPDEKPVLTEEDAEEHLPQSEQIRRAHEDRSRGRRKTIKRRERHVVKESAEVPLANLDDLPDGQIVRTEGAHFIIRMTSGEELRAKTVKSTRTENPNSTLAAVGDKVKIAQASSGDAEIALVRERKTKLGRKAAGRRDAFEQIIVSNADLVVIVTSALEPMFRPGIIDRYIVAALEGKLSIAIAINKLDLVDEDMMAVIQEYIDLYNDIGYPTFGISTATGLGLDKLRDVLQDKTSIFAGHSGVGKSSIVNWLFGEEINKTGRLSKKYGKGAHTTTSSMIIPIPGMERSFVVDTPGVREFANYELDAENLKFFFAEFISVQEHCAITNCKHIHEPGCAVLAAVEAGTISMDRYASYAKLYDEAESAEKKRYD